MRSASSCGRLGELVDATAAARRRRAAPRPCARAGRPGWSRSGGAGVSTGERSFRSSGRRRPGSGANGTACESAISPVLRSSSSATKATACSTRERPPTSPSKSNTRRRRSTARKRSRNCDTGGKRSAMCESDTFGGSTANPLSAPASADGLLRGEPPLDAWRERRRAEPEEAVARLGQPLAQPGGGLLHAPVLGQPPRELLGGLLRLELGELVALLGEEVARLQLEQRGDRARGTRRTRRDRARRAPPGARRTRRRCPPCRSRPARADP